MSRKKRSDMIELKECNVMEGPGDCLRLGGQKWLF